MKAEDKKLELEKLRHTCSHVLAHAVKKLFPKVRLGIGPAIENGFYYDFDQKEGFSPEDLKEIEKEMKRIIRQNLPLKKIEVSQAKAKEMLKGEKYKLELLNDLKGKITFYEQGEFKDLCKGPHLETTGDIIAFKLLKTSGAYWKGNSKNKMLQRIYGTAFFNKNELDGYVEKMEEAERRDHRKIGKQLNWFSFHEEAPGNVFWHPKGSIIYNEVLKYWREVHEREGYDEVKTPIILNKKLWMSSGHWDNFKENMYFTKIDDADFAIKPMNCPGGMLIYKSRLHSYREFPMRVAELGTCHRHELSGTLQGLFRVRMFTQDDAHIYCLPNQVKGEIKKIMKLILEMYDAFGFPEHKIELSTMPKNHIGSLKVWKESEKILQQVLKEEKVDYELNPGDGAFYGPKIDFHIKDCLERTWQCGTIQLDFSMPEKFDLTYEDNDGKKHRPVMLHRVVLGSIERFIGVLIENYAGKLPVWLNPVQVIVLTVTDRSKPFAKRIVEELKKNGIRVELDDRAQSVPKKIRDSQLHKANYTLTIGDKEVTSNTLAIRTLDGNVKFNVKLQKFIDDILKEIKERKNNLVCK